MKCLILLLPVFLCVSAYSQQKSCCAPTATESFSQLGGDNAFVKSHQEPLPFTFKSDNGKAITFKAPDGSDAFGWEIKARQQTNNYLFVIHEWWGLNDYIKKESEAWWQALGNVNVIAVDLYDQKVASTREEAGKYMQAVTSERAQAILNGAIQYAGSNAKIYTIGWCFGGGWSLQASLLAGAQAGGCVMYYGMPEKDPGKLQNLHADVLGIFANKDQWINPKIVDEFAADMKKANKSLTLKRYDADHAFANPSNPAFDKAAKDDAYKQALSFFKERMK